VLYELIVEWTFLEDKKCISKFVYHLHSINFTFFMFFVYSLKCVCHRFVNFSHV
jgi:hypothetical protein